MIQAHRRDRWRTTLVLCLGSFIVFINRYAPQPLLPELRATFGVSTLIASLVMSCATLALAASHLEASPGGFYLGPFWQLGGWCELGRRTDAYCYCRAE
ncbi:hypothetical protein [Halomonas salinarum]|uniref:hypothetical protein n=1 Tax=Halomonas salinarum TaxID=1158993 RepID=UPI001ADDF4CC